eukprot:2043874-Pyramimonas_sp.AAC.1
MQRRGCSSRSVTEVVHCKPFSALRARVDVSNNGFNKLYGTLSSVPRAAQAIGTSRLARFAPDRLRTLHAASRN